MAILVADVWEHTINEHAIVTFQCTGAALRHGAVTLLSHANLEEQLQEWQCSTKSLFAHEKTDVRDGCAAAITQLIENGGEYKMEAPPGGDDRLAHDSALVSALQRAVEHGLVDKQEPGFVWTLREGASQHLVALTELRSPIAAVTPRDLGDDFGNMSLLELMIRLEAAGFIWHQLPKSKKKKRALPRYQAGQPKHWYTGRALCKEYMQCLLRAEDLRAPQHVSNNLIVDHGLIS